MSKQYTISAQGMDKELSTATGEYGSFEFKSLSEEKSLEIIERISNIRDNLDYSIGEFCPPGFTVSFGKEDAESFFVDKGTIKYSETEKEVSAKEVLQIARKEIIFDMRKIREEKYNKSQFYPLRKKEILPTDRENISEEDINTSTESPQFEFTIWRSRKWLEASHTAPFAVGGFFAFIGLVVLGEKRDAEMAPLMFLIAVICFLTFFPWRTLAKTKIKCGIDWTTNTLWIKRKRNVSGFQPDANYIEEVVSIKYETFKRNPLWLTVPTTPIVFRNKQWILLTKHNYSEHLWNFNGAVFSTKKEAKAISDKFNQLLKTQN